MADNRMYLVHRPSGWAVYLGGQWGYEWSCGDGEIYHKLVELFRRAHEAWVDGEGSINDFVIVLEDAEDAPKCMSIEDYREETGQSLKLITEVSKDTKIALRLDEDEKLRPAMLKCPHCGREFAVYVFDDYDESGWFEKPPFCPFCGQVANEAPVATKIRELVKQIEKLEQENRGLWVQIQSQRNFQEKVVKSIQNHLGLLARATEVLEKLTKGGTENEKGA